MKVLVLSCNTGGGHNSAARAVMDALNEEQISCEMLDFLSLASQRVSKIVSNTYSGMTTHMTSLWHGIYQLGGAVSSPKRKSPVYAVLTSLGGKLLKYINENDFDLVVTTHIFAAETLTYLKRKRKLNIKTIFILTDYTPYPFTEELECDYCIVANDEVKKECIKKGVKEDIIYPWGIPVGQRYLETMDQKEAKEKLNLDVNKPMFLIMAGSMGFGNLGDIAKKLVIASNGNAQVIVVCGRNEKQKEKLQKQFENDEHVTIIGFTDQAPLYMNACDVIFTKPGGLTSTEAAVKNIPLIHTKPIPGCETQNAIFFSSRGMSYYSENIDEEIEYAVKLANDKKTRDMMKKCQKANTNPLAAKQIVNLIKDIMIK